MIIIAIVLLHLASTLIIAIVVFIIDAIVILQSPLIDG